MSDQIVIAVKSANKYWKRNIHSIIIRPLEFIQWKITIDNNLIWWNMEFCLKFYFTANCNIREQTFVVLFCCSKSINGHLLSFVLRLTDKHNISMVIIKIQCILKIGFLENLNFCYNVKDMLE